MFNYINKRNDLSKCTARLYTVSAELSRLYKSWALCGVALLALPMLHYSRYAIKYVQTLCCSSCMGYSVAHIIQQARGQPARSVTHYTYSTECRSIILFIYVSYIHPYISIHKTSMSIYALLMHIVNAAAHSEYVFTKIVTYSFNLKFIHKYVLLFARRSDEEKWQHRSYTHWWCRIWSSVRLRANMCVHVVDCRVML